MFCLWYISYLFHVCPWFLHTFTQEFKQLFSKILLGTSRINMLFFDFVSVSYICLKRRINMLFLWCYMFLQIRIQAIRGFPLLGKDTEFVSKIADVLGQLLTSGMVFLYYFAAMVIAYAHLIFCLHFRGKCGAWCCS